MVRSIQRTWMRMALTNQKGGVGKTTSVAILGYQFAMRGLKTLLIDGDPQGNLSVAFGIKKQDIKGTLYHLYSTNPEDADISIRDLILPVKNPNTDEPYENLFIVPCNISLAGVEAMNIPGKESILKNALDSIEGEYDIIIMDSPPSLGILTLSLLTAATDVLIPNEAGEFSTVGLQLLLNTITLVRRNSNPNLNLIGAFLTKHDPKLSITDIIVDMIQKQFPNKLLSTHIPDRTNVGKSQVYGVPIQLFDKKNDAAIAYENLALEILMKKGIIKSQRINEANA